MRLWQAGNGVAGRAVGRAVRVAVIGDAADRAVGAAREFDVAVAVVGEGLVVGGRHMVGDAGDVVAGVVAVGQILDIATCPRPSRPSSGNRDRRCGCRSRRCRRSSGGRAERHVRDGGGEIGRAMPRLLVGDGRNLPGAVAGVGDETAGTGIGDACSSVRRSRRCRRSSKAGRRSCGRR